MPRRVQIVLVVIAALSVLQPGAAWARSGGMASSAFGSTGCNQCHSGGSVPTVELDGPVVVDPGSTSEYTFTIEETAFQDHGGLNVSAAVGTLAIGGDFAASTQLFIGTGGRSEITHTQPKPADEDRLVRFSFLWTAPEEFSSVTFSAWGNAVDFNGTQSGDRAASTSLVVSSSGAATTPTPTPDATPSPTPVCATNLAPPRPVQVSNSDAQKCQDAIGKAGLAYTQGTLKAVQGCLLLFQKGKLSGDPTTLCIGTWETPPTDAKTAAKIAGAEAKALKFIGKKCEDSLLTELDSCADTLEGLESCLITEHAALVQWVIADQFGALIPTADKGEQKCQKVIAGESAKFLSATLKSTQKCLSAANKSSALLDTASLCMGSVVDGVFVPPTDAKTAAAISKVAGKLRSKLVATCTEAQAAALDSCAGDVASLEECLPCTHRAVTYQAIGVGYGGLF